VKSILAKGALIALLSLGVTVPYGQICRADAATDRDATNVVLKETQALRATSPQQAVERIQKFQQEHAGMDPLRLTLLDIALANVYFDDLKQPDKALAAMNTAMARTDKPDAYLPLVYSKAGYLARSGKYDESIALFKKELPKFLAEPTTDFAYLRNALNWYEYSARKSGKRDDYIATLRSIVEVHPELAAYRVVGREMAQYYAEQPGKETEALSWAKLYWVLCDFDERTLNDATTLLQKSWVARDMNAAKSSQFLKAMQDPKSPNPLSDIPLPVLDGAKMRAALKSLPESSTHSRITLHLLLKENGAAMLEARRILLNDPSGAANAAALEMARVFKATDLNLVRANAFLKYFQSNEGDNPLDEFFKQNPVGAEK
jgi:hypothetical protein